MGDWAARVEGQTLVTADAHGERWESDDIEFVKEFTDVVSDEELAYALGRSLYALWNIQYRLRRGELIVAPERIGAAQREQRARTYTFIDGDVPPGW